MEHETILENLSEVFATVFDQDLDLSEATTADEVQGWDSLNHIRLMVSIEKEFKIRFETGEINTLKDVGALIRLIATKTESK